jgi:hypothetical protein
MQIHLKINKMAAKSVRAWLSGSEVGGLDANICMSRGVLHPLPRRHLR